MQLVSYIFRVCTLLDDVKGNQTEPVSFKTKACEPDHPPLPKLSSKNKTSITLKWNVSIALYHPGHMNDMRSVIND